MSEPGGGAMRPPAGTREGFEEAYSGSPPWDIGRPQPALVESARAGLIEGRVLDVGCGTGEHALFAAGLGLQATGIDAAPTAIAIAKRKGAERGLDARFLVWDAFELESLGQEFDTVIDSALFHVFDDPDRVRFVAALGALMRPGDRYLMLCFSDRQPGDFGPRRVSEAEIRSSFANGWEVRSLSRVRMELTMPPAGADAWLAEIVRL